MTLRQYLSVGWGNHPQLTSLNSTLDINSGEQSSAEAEAGKHTSTNDELSSLVTVILDNAEFLALTHGMSIALENIIHAAKQAKDQLVTSTD